VVLAGNLQVAQACQLVQGKGRKGCNLVAVEQTLVPKFQSKRVPVVEVSPAEGQEVC